MDFTTLEKRPGVTDGVLATYPISAQGRQGFTGYLAEMRRPPDAVESGKAK